MSTIPAAVVSAIDSHLTGLGYLIVVKATSKAVVVVSCDILPAPTVQNPAVQSARDVDSGSCELPGSHLPTFADNGWGEIPDKEPTPSFTKNPDNPLDKGVFRVYNLGVETRNQTTNHEHEHGSETMQTSGIKIDWTTDEYGHDHARIEGTHRVTEDLWATGYLPPRFGGKIIDEGYLAAGTLIRKIRGMRVGGNIPDSWCFEASTDGGKSWCHEEASDFPACDLVRD